MSKPTHQAGAPDVDEEKQRLRQEIAARVGLDSQAAAEEGTFWREVGLRYQTAVPDATPLQLAQLVLTKLGATEDESHDFVEEEGQSVGLGAYEWILTYLSKGAKGEDTSEDEEEDEESGALAREHQIVVQPVDNSIQTIAEMIENGTIVLDPDWQRGYVWKPRQKRRFVESVLLNLPIPPVLLFRDKDNKLYVIDGRQRLETAYRFRLGSKNRKESFRTFSAKQPGWAPGDKLNPAANKHFDKLPEHLQRFYNAFVIPARVFSYLPRRTLYEVFRRYNTGSEKLRPAEIRKAVFQGSPLHEMMFAIAGESGVETLSDLSEREVARQLEGIMRNKKARYGAYNFVGRCLAFANVTDDMSVANAINKFMDDHASEDPRKYREDFVKAFETTMRWYEDQHPLCVTDADGIRVSFHEWVATIQIVSTMKMLQRIRAGETTEEAVQNAIRSEWNGFVYGTFNEQANDNIGGLLQDKQNTTSHWGRQREWIKKLENSVGIKQPLTAQ